MKLLRNSEIPVDKWRFLLEISPYSSPFQTWEFYNLYNSVPGLSAGVFAVEISGDIKSLCVVTRQKERGFKAWFSRRAIIYGGPIFEPQDYEAAKFLINSIDHQFRNEVIYTEIRNFADYSDLKGFYEETGWQWLPYLNIKLSLKDTSLTEVLAAMKYNRRREVKQSLNEGVTYREAANIKDVRGLYLILKELYSEKVKLPVPDVDFFLSLYNSEAGKVFIVLHNGKIIGGSFCLYINGGTIYTMYYCGLRNYHPRIFPTHLSILAAIDFGIREKLEYIDFMGAGLKDKSYGVRNYKLEFGGQLLEYGRFRKVYNKLLFRTGVKGLEIIKHLKR